MASSRSPGPWADHRGWPNGRSRPSDAAWPLDGEVVAGRRGGRVTAEMSGVAAELETLLGYVATPTGVHRGPLPGTAGRRRPRERSARHGRLCRSRPFTRLSRQEPDGSELASLVPRRSSRSAQTWCNGESARLVKTLGDEVMFVADTPDHAARICLSLHRIPHTVAQMLPARTGLATGAVLKTGWRCLRHDGEPGGLTYDGPIPSGDHRGSIL